MAQKFQSCIQFNPRGVALNHVESVAMALGKGGYTLKEVDKTYAPYDPYTLAVFYASDSSPAKLDETQTAYYKGMKGVLDIYDVPV